MVEIIKEGVKKFYATCSKCGCQFSYELNDLITGIGSDFVRCPECEEKFYHPRQGSSISAIITTEPYKTLVGKGSGDSIPAQDINISCDQDTSSNGLDYANSVCLHEFECSGQSVDADGKRSSTSICRKCGTCKITQYV